ncbi:MAG TPA: hypothetical protein VN678_02825, partial [Acidobacteriaceae bacterium]|nr:hypothetical protein [Acidobacteriaceae bacterium]
MQVASAVRSGSAVGVIVCVSGGLALGAFPLRAQDAKAIVQQAVNTELEVSRTDHTHWRYTESEMDGSRYVVVETQYGEVKRHLGASADVLRQDDEYNQRFAHDPALQQKQRQAGLHDDRSATELLNEMPEAFVWKLERETGDEIALSYHPNPDYRPPDMESRVMGQMAGTMVVSKPGHRIKTFKGRLTNDIEIGWGLLAKIHQGGTFDVERRQIAPGEWAITETHVHISGHALFFKTIGQQEDEVKTDFTLVPPGTTL